MNKGFIAKEFEDLFKFKNKKQEIEHEARMVSFRFLSEVEVLCDKRKINRTELAKKLKTSKSYITQLMRGDKLLNLTMIARIQDALGIKFKIKADNQKAD